GEAEVHRKAEEVRRPSGAGDLRGAVRRAVVDDEDLDGVEPRDAPRQRGERFGEAPLFVEAGNLDDELHTPEERVTASARESICPTARRSASLRGAEADVELPDRRPDGPAGVERPARIEPGVTEVARIVRVVGAGPYLGRDAGDHLARRIGRDDLRDGGIDVRLDQTRLHRVSRIAVEVTDGVVRA